MADLLALVIPLAVGAAVSPTLLTLELLILSAKQSPVVRAWSFVLGASFILFVYTALGLTVLSRVSIGDDSGESIPTAAGKLVIGLILLGLGLRQLIRRPTSAEKTNSRWKDRIATARPRAFLVVGMLGMLSNFSTLVLFLPALHDISRAHVSLSGKVLALGLLLLITLSTLLAPVLAITLLGGRARPVLDRMNQFTSRNQRKINAGIALFFGVWLCYGGLAGLI